MPLRFIRDDITKLNIDAIVLPANPVLEEGSGTSKAIFVAAGEKQMTAELRLRYPDGCEIGKAVITHGYDLPAKWVIHAVCPQWLGGDQGERDYLYSAYRESMLLADSKHCKTLAFPLLSTGNYKFPRIEAIRIAINAILDFVADHDMDVFLVFFTKEGLRDGNKLFGDIKSSIDDTYAEDANARNIYIGHRRGKFYQDDWYDQRESFKASQNAPVETDEIYDIMSRNPETFREMLFRLIGESGQKEPEVYKAAHITRQHFGKIKLNEQYTPKKKTILQLAIALHLTTGTTETLLKKAGYALSDSDDFDRIMKYCLDKRMFDFHEINELLWAYDLGDEVFPIREK